jgi:hypothetical protein
MFGLDIPTFMMLIYTAFAVVVFLMAILMPFFVLRIRNESIKTNQLLDDIRGRLDGRHLSQS